MKNIKWRTVLWAVFAALALPAAALHAQNAGEAPAADVAGEKPPER